MRQAGTFVRLCRVLTAICLLALTAGAAHAEGAQTEMFDRNTPIQTVLDDPAFGDYGRLLFPVDAGYFSGNTLGNLRLTWYSHIDPDETVEIVNTLRNRVLNGEIVFYDIYTEAEKAADPDKRDTGLFFFKGTPGAKFAVCNAGGGFAYVGAMHDSFPHALELSKNICGGVRNVLDRFYGRVQNGGLSGRRLYFVFQGAAPEKWMLEAGEYTMKRFAVLYGMSYEGMATDKAEAERLNKTL